MNMIQLEKRSGEYMHNNMIYQHAFRKGSVLYLPADPRYGGPEAPEYYTSIMFEAAKNPEIYRKAVTDESLPPTCLDIEGASDKCFGRYVIITALGLIGYERACPDLREAMLHDNNEGIRGESAIALGRIGNMAYTPDIIHAMQDDKSLYTQDECIRSLGSMKDKRALAPLMEYFEDCRARIHFKALTGKDPTHYWDEYHGVETSITSMLKIGGRLADETLKKALNDRNGAVRNASKNAIIMSGRWRDEKIFIYSEEEMKRYTAKHRKI